MTLRSSKDFEVEKEPGLQRHADNLLISLSILVFKMDLHLEVLDVPLYPFVDLLGLAGAECMNRNLELFFFWGVFLMSQSFGLKGNQTKLTARQYESCATGKANGRTGENWCGELCQGLGERGSGATEQMA